MTLSGQQRLWTAPVSHQWDVSVEPDRLRGLQRCEASWELHLEESWKGPVHRAPEDTQMVVGMTRPPTSASWKAARYERDVTVEACRKLCERGQLTEAVYALGTLVQAGGLVSTSLFYSVLKGCIAHENLGLGCRVHALAVKAGFQSNTFLANQFLRMYASRGRLQEATQVFAQVPVPDYFMWVSNISAHVEHGKPTEAIKLYQQMCLSTVKPDSYVFVAVLKACAASADLKCGMQVHAEVLASQIPPNKFVANSLVDMYAKCGSMEESRRVFDGLFERDVVTWNSIINGYAKHGLGQQALSLYERMQQEGLILANKGTFACLLKACTSVGAIQKGKQLHSQIVERGLETDILIGNCLVSMYAKCGSLEDARMVFDSLPARDVVTWNSMMNGYAEHGDGHSALALYVSMEETGTIVPDNISFACLLKACTSVGAVQEGKQLHSKIVKRGLIADVIIGNCLVDMYAKCGSLEEARMVFDSLPTRNVVTWNSMINGYAEHGLGLEALTLYSKMEHGGMIVPSNITFACLLKGCTSVGALQEGKRLHSQIVKRGLETDMVVGTCLVNMYAKCGSLEDARRVFDNSPTRDVVAWTAMINGYADHGDFQEALALYTRMKQESMIVSNNINFACLLKACTSVGAVQQGKQLHAEIVERGLEVDIVIGNYLVDMYAKFGSLEDARRVFDSLSSRDVVTWTAMIAGYSEQGHSHEALAIYREMEQEARIAPNNVTFACLLKACTSCGALELGKRVHSQIVERGLEADMVLGACLVDFYAKCGSLEDARRVFDSLATRNVVTWNSMIGGFGQSNAGRQAIRCFHEMLRERVEPNGTTFVCLLVACSHEGLVQEGQQYFSSMVKDHGIVPSKQHYVCMVDLLGRAGHVEDAEKMLLSMPFESEVVGWMSLLNACRSHGDMERGTRCFENIVKLDPQKASAYVLMGNMYADAGRWSDVGKIEKLRNSVGASKKPARAGIEVNRQVHTFVVGEKRPDLGYKVRNVNDRLKAEGCHVPHTGLVLKPVSVREKEDELCGHAEKLALAYGLLNTPDGAPLLVTKNLRMCSDCHSATQIMSRTERRHIVVRDAHRVHRFVEGSCSCGDRP